MARLIDADALHEALNTKQKWVVRCGDKHNEGYTYDQVHFAIDEAPTIDAVSVVHGEWKPFDLKWGRSIAMPFLDIVWCEECKHKLICSHSVQHTTHEPTSVTIGYKSVDYCSYGERREP